MEPRLTTTFEIFVHDDRYSVPTLHLVSVRDEAAAHAAASTLLRASPHHRGVELWQGEDQIETLGACAERRRSERGPDDALRVASAG
jgi:hypothetical protein